MKAYKIEYQTFDGFDSQYIGKSVEDCMNHVRFFGARSWKQIIEEIEVSEGFFHD